MSGRAYLSEIKKNLKDGLRQHRRGDNVLAAYGYMRRRQTSVDQINQDMEDLGLVAAPPISTSMPLNAPYIRFKLAAQGNGETSTYDRYPGCWVRSGGK